jgi:hypothetical protein
VSSLTQIPPAERRKMALALAPIATVLLVAGVVPVMVTSSLAWKLVGVAVILIATVLLGVVLGLRRSAAEDEAAGREAELDAAILATPGPCGSECGTGACGVDDCALKALPRS